MISFRTFLTSITTNQMLKIVYNPTYSHYLYGFSALKKNIPKSGHT